jgi:hypothetical protein
VQLKLERSAEAEASLSEAGTDATYDPKWGVYKMSLSKGALDAHRETVKALIQQAYEGGTVYQ